MNRILVRRALSSAGSPAWGTHCRSFLRIGKLCPADRAARRPGCGFRGQRGAGEPGRTRIPTRNRLAHHTQFMETNLFEINEAWMREQGHFDKMLIDPPREGAIAAVTTLQKEQNTALADRVCILQSGYAGPRCGRTGASEWIFAEGRGRGEHVSAYRACRIHCAVRERAA